MRLASILWTKSRQINRFLGMILGFGAVKARQSNGLWLVSDRASADSLFYPNWRRVSKAREGLRKRVESLAEDYILDKISVLPGDTLIDIGANAGELGLWCAVNSMRYIAFEPDPSAFRALQRNFPASSLYEVGLGESNEKLEFHLRGLSGDSSFVRPLGKSTPIEILVRRLDDFKELLPLEGNIRILKVEAEGFEPQVIRGGKALLARVDYVSVDAGIENAGKATVVDVSNAMYGLGFVLQDFNPARLILLFRKTGI